jgi:hypothetical protein
MAKLALVGFIARQPFGRYSPRLQAQVNQRQRPSLAQAMRLVFTRSVAVDVPYTIRWQYV